jgi:hypothetical protein
VLAQRCSYVAAGDVDSALAVLRRRKTPEALSTAARVAMATGHGAAPGLARTAGLALQAGGRWAEAREMLAHAGDQAVWPVLMQFPCRPLGTAFGQGRTPMFDCMLAECGARQQCGPLLVAYLFSSVH